MMGRTLGRQVLKRYACKREVAHMRWSCLYCGFINRDIKCNVKGQRSENEDE